MISIIIPLFNKERYITATLRSVLAQTYTDFEVIVVDDGSSDRGPEQVAGMGDPRIRLHRQINAGPGAARNTGIRLARGEWLLFLDADDTVEPAFLTEHMTALAAHPDCAFSISGYTRGPDRQSNESEMRARGFVPGPWRLDQSRDPADEAHYLAGWACHSGAIVVRRDAITAAGGFYDRKRCLFGEDHILWLGMLLNHVPCLLLKPLMWINTEASDLGPAQQGNHPPRPILTDPGWLQGKVPHRHRGIVRYVRSRIAVLHVRQCLDQSRWGEAGRYLPATWTHHRTWPRALRETIRFPLHASGLRHAPA